ncbi:MAG: hypothetical protein IJ760_01575 [Bacteroidales bacterium]|nr:hypothetical protein [Bacteroidales bacterium]
MKYLLAILALTLTACVSPVTHTSSADSLVQERETTLDEAIGNMLLVGFRGTEIDSTHHIWRDISQRHVGAVILFDYDAPTGKRGRNIVDTAQVRRLCAQLRAANPNLLIGIDQEGGYVSRLAPRHGFARIPSARSSAEQGIDSVRKAARITAHGLASLGINLDFAPVADVDVNPRCPVIGAIERSFSADTAVVAECCAVWLDELAKAGVAGCMKHFPGHGSASGDTHKGLVDVSSTWQRGELAPYRLAAPGERSMVMTAHVVNRRLDPSGLPASLSPRITSLLRDSLGFGGVIVTDDLAMGAIVGEYSLEQAVRMAVLAGADLLCLSNNGGTYDPAMVERAVAVVKKMVADGEVGEERIKESAMRVKRLVQGNMKNIQQQ